MSRSFAQSVALPCGNCGQSFMAEVWLIVDAAERPELADRIRAETIHTLRCAHCGTDQPIDAPLLFHDGHAQTLIFATQEAISPEQNQELARQLGQQLIASIPLAERQPYLTTAQVVAGVAGLHDALAGSAEQTSDELSQALPALMAAESPAAVQAVAHEHPVLHTAEALAQLRAYVAQLRADQHSPLADALAQRVDVLAQGQPAGRPLAEPHPAFAIIQALLEAESPEQRQTLLSSQATTITPEIPTMIAALADQAQRQQHDAIARDLRVIRDEVLRSLEQQQDQTPEE